MSDAIQEETVDRGEVYLCRAVFGYKPDSLFTCPEEAKRYSKGVILDDDLGELLVDIRGVREATKEELENPEFDTVFKPLVRLATQEDILMSKENQRLEEEVFNFTKNNARELEMDLRLVKVVYSLDSKAVMIMYYASDRVDFREFVKICASRFHVRVKMWQIGNKDRAKIVGGIGVCGLPLCCSTFLDTFVKTSISMAKTQLLNLNIPKISGQCGNLMCCLGYENEYYKELIPLFPKVGDSVTFKAKTWTVVSINVIADSITVTDESKEMLETYSNENWKRIKNGEEPLEEIEEDESTKRILEDIDSRRIPGPKFMPIIDKDVEKKKEEETIDLKMEIETKEEETKGEEEMKYKKKNKHGNINNTNNGNANKRKGMPRPGPFGFKPAKLSNEHQAQVNPFGFASHNTSNNNEDAKVEKISTYQDEPTFQKEETKQDLSNNNNNGYQKNKHYNNHNRNNNYHKNNYHNKHDDTKQSKGGFDPSKLTLPDEMK